MQTTLPRLPFRLEIIRNRIYNTITVSTAESSPPSYLLDNGGPRDWYANFLVEVDTFGRWMKRRVLAGPATFDLDTHENVFSEAYHIGQLAQFVQSYLNLRMLEFGCSVRHMPLTFSR